MVQGYTHPRLKGMRRPSDIRLDLYVRSAAARWELPPGSQKCWSNGANTGRFPIGVSTDHTLPESEKALQALVASYAKAHDIELEIHDLALKVERRTAWLKGIWHTPALVVNPTRMRGVPVNVGALEPKQVR